MADHFYYAKDGVKMGPVSGTTLKALAQSGSLLPTDMVWKEGVRQWKSAGRVKGLFAPSTVEVSVALAPTTSSTNTESTMSFKDWYNSKITPLSLLPHPVAFILQGLTWLLYGFIWIPTWYFNTRHHAGGWPNKPRWSGVIVFLLFAFPGAYMATSGQVQETVEIQTGVRFATDIFGRTRLDRLEHQSQYVTYERQATVPERIGLGFLSLIMIHCSYLCWRHHGKSMVLREER